MIRLLLVLIAFFVWPVPTVLALEVLACLIGALLVLRPLPR